MQLLGVILALVLVGATIANLSVSRWSDAESESVALPTVGDVTTLALDRDGADLVAVPTTHAPDATGLALDRDGADLVTNATNAPLNTTTLLLDHNGADIVAAPANVGPDMTGLHLDRNGADLP